MKNRSKKKKRKIHHFHSKEQNEYHHKKGGREVLRAFCLIYDAFVCFLSQKKKKKNGGVQRPALRSDSLRERRGATVF